MSPTSSQPTRVAALVDALAARILANEWASGEPLPPERELSEQLGVSRPTLREALRQLERLGLVQSRRGSGTRVTSWRHTATLEVLPLFLRFGAGPADLEQALVSGLRMRLVPIFEAIAWLAERRQRVDFGGLRQELDDVWAQRDDPRAFTEQDFHFVRSLVATSGLYPALWMLNAFAPFYMRMVDVVGLLEPPTDAYMATWTAVLDRCRAGEGAAARAVAEAYFADLDRRLLARAGLPTLAD